MLAAFIGGACLSALPANAGRTVIDGGITLNFSGYCSPAAAGSPGGCSPIPLPFSVQIAGQTYNNVYVNSNGTLSFNSIASQLASQNSWTGQPSAGSYTGPTPADSIGDYAGPIFSPNFRDGPGYALVNFNGPSAGYDGAFASTNSTSGNSLTVSFFACTSTVACGQSSINIINNATFDPNLTGLTGLLIQGYSGNPGVYTPENFNLGRANYLAELASTLDIYTVTLTGLSDGFRVDYGYSPGALGDIGTSGFNLAGGLNETTGPLANSSFRFDGNGQLITAAIPEPGTWATMLLGFALAGCAMRRRSRTLRPATA